MAPLRKPIPVGSNAPDARIIDVVQGELWRPGRYLGSPEQFEAFQRCIVTYGEDNRDEGLIYQAGLAVIDRRLAEDFDGAVGVRQAAMRGEARTLRNIASRRAEMGCMIGLVVLKERYGANDLEDRASHFMAWGLETLRKMFGESGETFRKARHDAVVWAERQYEIRLENDCLEAVGRQFIDMAIVRSEEPVLAAS